MFGFFILLKCKNFVLYNISKKCLINQYNKNEDLKENILCSDRGTTVTNDRIL